MEKDKAILVGVNLNKGDNVDYSMDELWNLSEACNIEPKEKVVQSLKRITPDLYIGFGKVYEIKELCEEHDANMVIFNDELSPAHIRNLEEILQCQVIDRTYLILDIFARRAKTKEAMLQVELAQQKYMLPRLVGLRNSLSRQAGGAKLRGPGEKKLELDRRRILSQISKLKKDLKDVVEARKIQRVKRKKNNVPIVALVGYTNAGKSSVMNSILEVTKSSEKNVYEENMLFATLETSTRKVSLENNKSFLLTDTVGFVSKLPHHLVNAFKSTLEELLEADLLIHVVDYTNPLYEKQIEVTKEVLYDIGVRDLPTIYAFNKIDNIEDDNLFSEYDNTIFISAKEKTNIDKLINEVENNLFKNYHVVDMIIPFEKQSIVSVFKDKANVLEIEYETNGTHLKVELSDELYSRYKEYEVVND